MNNVFIVELLIDMEAPSENFLYKPGVSKPRNQWAKGRGSWGHGYLYLDPEIAEFKEELIRRVKSSISENLPPLERVNGIVSSYMFGVDPDRYWARDVTNMVKAVEDAIFASIPWDDCQVEKSCCGKVRSEKPFIYCQLGLLTSAIIDPTEVMMEMLKTEVNYA